MWANGVTASLRVSGCMNIQMVIDMRVISRHVSSTVKGLKNILKAIFFVVISSRVRRMVMENIIGRTVVTTKVIS